MEGNLYTPENIQNASRQHRMEHHPFVRLLALAVAFCTVFSLIPPAAVMAAANDQTLDCPLTVHQHETACYDGEGALICGLADFVVHTHTDGCYDGDSNLVCELPEVKVHEHTDACYTTGQTLTCELAADETHAHGEGCYESVQAQVCTQEVIVLHTHSDACRDTEGSLTCGKLEVVEHIHTDACFTGTASENTTPTEATTQSTTETTVETTVETTAETTVETTEATEAPIMLLGATIVAEGDCGEGAKWALTDDGVLTIYGSGPMTDYSSGSNTPWYSYRSQFNSVVVGNGVTSVGNNAFYNDDNLTSVTILDGVTSVGNYAFYDCDYINKIVLPAGLASIGKYAFTYAKITELAIPDSVVSIGANAFYYCYKLTSVTIPESVTTISDSTFYGCYGLTSITIPEGVASIGNSAFYGCYGLTSVAIPDSVTSIGSSAFSSCSKLTSITIPEGVTTIKSSTFSGCSSLTSVILPKTVVSIDNSAFHGCTGLTSINIPENVTTIGSSAFYGCSSLTSINIPENVTTIGGSAFYGCTGLTGITIPEKVTTIGNSAFSNCSGLTSITIPASITSIGSSAFSGCTGLAEIVVAEDNQKYCSVDGALYSKDLTTLYYYPSAKAGSSEVTLPDSVTTISSYAFSSCTGLTSIAIPESVKTIGSYAFYNCSNLTSVTLPEGITTITNYTFYGCSSLTDITIPEGVTSISNSAFQKCSSLTDIAIPEKVTTISDSAFAGCSSLTSVTLPTGLKTIESSAFSGCSGLADITIPDSVTTISSYAFSGCSGLTSIAIPENVKTIGNNAFYNCSNLTSVVIPEGVTTISSYTFYGCSNLTDIAIPNSVTYISYNAFQNCSSLTNITIPEKVTSISDTTFYGCASLTSVTLPDGLKTIGSSAFSGCSSLTDITLPDSVTSISSYAFHNCSSLTGITIPENVKSISYDAFNNCDSLTEVVIPDSVTSLGSYTFYDCDNLERIVIGNGVKTIDTYTFRSCDKLSQVVIGDSVTTIVSNAFQDCSKLTSITIGKSLTSLDAFSFSSYSGLTEIIVDEENPAYCSVDGALYSRDPMVLLVYPRKTDSTEVTLPEGLESIADRAFYNWDNLTSVTIPDSVVSIGSSAFSDCDNLETVVIGDGVKTIGSSAFYSCNKLANVTFGSSVESIGNQAFEYCSSLTSITIPDNVASIGSSAFSNCDKLESVVIGDGVTTIGNSAFNSCDVLADVTIGSSVETIGNSAFSNCYKLTNVALGSSVKSIGDAAFNNCDNLTSIDIPDSVTSIGNSAFNDCDGLTGIVIPDNVTTLGNRAFYSCGKLESAVIGDGVTAIPNDAFRYCSNLSNVSIGDSATSIGDYAFGDCSKLAGVSIGKNVTQISSTAFYNCGSLVGFEVDPENEAFCSVDGVLYSKDMTTLLRYPPNKTEPLKVTIPESVTTIADSAFSGCSKLTKITLPENVTSIGNSAFNGCSSLTSVNVPEGVTSIGNYAFGYCSSLTGIVIPDSVTILDHDAFYKCSKLSTVKLSNNLTVISNYLFQECSSLTSIVIPEGVTSIGNSAFSGCSSLTSCSIPEGVTSIGYYAFYNCSRLTNVTVPASVGSIGYSAFNSCSSLTSIVIPDGVTSIDSETFKYCHGLSNVTIPGSITSIGANAFYYCNNLTSIVIPGSVKSIGKEAFSYCYNLTDITIENSSVTLGENALRGCSKLKHVTVGKNADTITSGILDTLGAASGGITRISADGPNYFRYSGTDYAVEKMTMTEGDYYADEHGVLYRLNSDGTATLLYAPEGLSAEQYEIPASIPAEGGNRTYTVTGINNTAFQGCKDLKGIIIPGSVAAIGDSTFKDCKALRTVTLSDGITTIGDSAFQNCSALTEVTIPDSVTSIGHYAFQNCRSLTQATIPEDIAGIGVYAFGDCYRLARVNGESSLSAVVEMLSGGGATPATFLNSALTGDDETVTVDDILVESGDGRQIGLSTPVTQGLTGEWLETKLSISTGKADNAGVVRVYFQFTNEHGMLKYPVGTHTFDGIEAETFAADIPNTYYIQFQPMKAEDERGISLYSTYAASVSGGGAARIWAEALTIEEAEALGNGVTEPETVHRLSWLANQPDSYQLSMSLYSYNSGFYGDGTAETDASLGSSTYNIKMTQVGESAAQGVDHLVSVDFVNTVVLPEYFKWPEGVVEAINEGNCHVRHSGSTAYYYVTAGGKTHYLAYVNTSNAGEAKLAVDASGNIQFHWTYMNPDPSKAVSSISPSFYMQDKVILANKEKLYEAGAGEGTSITCTVENQLTATAHYAYSEDQILEASATRTVSAGSTFTISASTESYPTMGESAPFSFTIKNDSALPYTALDYVTYPALKYYYIAPRDMEAMFYDGLYGKDLSITIKNATLCTPVSHTVTGTDGEDHVITQQHEGTGTSYEGCVSSGNDTGIVTEKVAMTIGWSDDRSSLVLTVGETEYTIGKGCDYPSLQVAFDSIGYLITYADTYTCKWDQRGQTLYCGGNRQFVIPTTAKDAFMRLTRDQDYFSNYSTGNYHYAYGYPIEGKGNRISGYAWEGSTLYYDFALSKSVYSDGVVATEETPVTAGDVLTYRVSVDHDGAASYDAIPLVDNMEAGQVLLVSVADNPALADQSLETMEVDGASFYLLNKPGTYEDVRVGSLLADRVEIKMTNGAIDTMIYWYLTDISGNVTVTAEYLALVSPETSNTVTEDGTIKLVNEVWLNDRQTHRLYDETLVYAMTLEDISKDIVTNLTDLSVHDPAADELAARTAVREGQTVTYRVMLKAAEGTEHTIRGSNLSDALPLNPNGYWGPDNIAVTYIPGADSSVDIQNGDSWRIDTENSSSKRQYLRWNDDFSATVEGTLYIYVTLTFPTGEQWSAYCNSYHNTELTGIFRAYHLTAQVSHLLSVPSEALLQQGVQFTGLTGPANSYNNLSSSTYRINSEADSLGTYTNDAQYAGIVTYYITLYNGGESRLYLSDVQAVLPEGFTFYGLYYHPYNSSYSYSVGSSTNSSNSDYYSKLISVRDAGRSSISYRSVDVRANTAVNDNGRQVATFTLTGCSYDSHWGKYYLNSGEAVVIAYHCRTNGYSGTQDAATGTVSMPFYDYTGTGVSLDTETAVDRKINDGKTPNSGSRLLVTNGGAATHNVDTGDSEMTTMWLASEVTVTRGGIQPGITKTATTPYAHVRDTVTWSVQVTNSGKDDMRGYTLTDVMMSPYQFTGTVSYRVAYDYNTALYAYNDDLFTFGPRTPGDSVVTITYGSNKTAELTVNGGCQQIETVMRVRYNDTPSYLDKQITIRVSLSRDDNGNEVLSVLFPADTAAAANIPAHSSATMTLQTRNFSGVYSNTSFYNTAYITPGEEQPFDANAVTQGNYVVYGGADSVVSEGSVAVSYGYYTPAFGTVREIDKPSNNAVSTDTTSHIILDDAASPFRYTLTVQNTGGTADSIPMDLLVFVNNLPQPEDHATFHPEIPRHSQFRVNFHKDPALTVDVDGTVLDEDAYVLQFSQTTEFTSADMDGTGTDGWYTLEEINADASLSLKDMRSFRVVIRDDTNTLMPGDAQITVGFNAEIDLSQVDIEPSSTAWNSFGYHYSLAGSAEELSASSQNVGVRTAAIPCLVKELEDSNGDPFAAKVDTTFRFVIYEGEALTLSDGYTQEDVFSALAGSTFTVVDVTVKAGEATSDIGLGKLYRYSCEDGSLAKTETAWLWQNEVNYTILELPFDSESIYRFGSFNETEPNNYTFAFDSSVTQTVTCLNVCDLWNIQLEKQSQLTAEPLAGAVFGLYSPAAVDLISDEQFSALTALLTEVPEKTIEAEGRTWYLLDIRTTDDEGLVLWSGLVEKQYYLLELQAPTGYHPNKQPGQVIRAVAETAAVTVTNAPCYELPDSGGMGTTAFYAAGAALTSLSLLLGWCKKRRSKNS